MAPSFPSSICTCFCLPRRPASWLLLATLLPFFLPFLFLCVPFLLLFLFPAFCFLLSLLLLYKVRVSARPSRLRPEPLCSRSAGASKKDFTLDQSTQQIAEAEEFKFQLPTREERREERYDGVSPEFEGRPAGHVPSVEPPSCEKEAGHEGLHIGASTTSSSPGEPLAMKEKQEDLPLHTETTSSDTVIEESLRSLPAREEERQEHFQHESISPLIKPIDKDQQSGPSFEPFAEQSFKGVPLMQSEEQQEGFLGEISPYIQESRVRKLREEFEREFFSPSMEPAREQENIEGGIMGTSMEPNVQEALIGVPSREPNVQGEISPYIQESRVRKLREEFEREFFSPSMEPAREQENIEGGIMGTSMEPNVQEALIGVPSREPNVQEALIGVPSRGPNVQEALIGVPSREPNVQEALIGVPSREPIAQESSKGLPPSREREKYLGETITHSLEPIVVKGAPASEIEKQEELQSESTIPSMEPVVGEPCEMPSAREEQMQELFQSEPSFPTMEIEKTDDFCAKVISPAMQTVFNEGVSTSEEAKQHDFQPELGSYAFEPIEQPIIKEGLSASQHDFQAEISSHAVEPIEMSGHVVEPIEDPLKQLPSTYQKQEVTFETTSVTMQPVEGAFEEKQVDSKGEIMSPSMEPEEDWRELPGIQETQQDFLVAAGLSTQRIEEPWKDTPLPAQEKQEGFETGTPPMEPEMQERFQSGVSGPALQRIREEHGKGIISGEEEKQAHSFQGEIYRPTMEPFEHSWKELSAIEEVQHDFQAKEIPARAAEKQEDLQDVVRIPAMELVEVPTNEEMEEGFQVQISSYTREPFLSGEEKRLDVEELQKEIPEWEAEEQEDLRDVVSIPATEQFELPWKDEDREVGFQAETSSYITGSIEEPSEQPLFFKEKRKDFEAEASVGTVEPTEEPWKVLPAHEEQMQADPPAEICSPEMESLKEPRKELLACEEEKISNLQSAIEWRLETQKMPKPNGQSIKELSASEEKQKDFQAEGSSSSMVCIEGLESRIDSMGKQERIEEDFPGSKVKQELLYSTEVSTPSVEYFEELESRTEPQEKQERIEEDFPGSKVKQELLYSTEVGTPSMEYFEELESRTEPQEKQDRFRRMEWIADFERGKQEAEPSSCLQEGILDVSQPQTSGPAVEFVARFENEPLAREEKEEVFQIETSRAAVEPSQQLHGDAKLQAKRQEEQNILADINAIKKILGYYGDPHASIMEQIRALYMFLGMEPLSWAVQVDDFERERAELELLKAVVGIK